MQESIDATVSPNQVWEAWEKAHQLNSGQQGTSKKFKYKVLDVKKGESFSILWKTLFVRLIFTQSVHPRGRGSEIRYGVQVKGLFAWPIRFLLGKKIKSNLRMVLKSIVYQLERETSQKRSV